MSTARRLVRSKTYRLCSVPIGTEGIAEEEVLGLYASEAAAWAAADMRFLPTVGTRVYVTRGHTILPLPAHRRPFGASSRVRQ